MSEDEKERSPKAILHEMRKLQQEWGYKHHTTGKLTTEFAELLVKLADQSERSTNEVIRLTWRLFWLTVVLCLIAVAQLAMMFK